MRRLALANPVFVLQCMMAACAICRAQPGTCLDYHSNPVSGHANFAVVNPSNQSFKITGSPTGGSFTLRFTGSVENTITAQNTGTLNHNATAAQVQTALRNLAAIADTDTDVFVCGGPGPGSTFHIRFDGQWADQTMRLLTLNSNSLTGGTSPSVGFNQQESVGMADPTVLQVADPANGKVWFYVTGTSEDYATSNFPLYRSADLVTWEFVKTAFKPYNDTNNDHWTKPFPYPRPCGPYACLSCGETADCPGFIPLPYRDTVANLTYYLSGLWSPQLFTNPNDTCTDPFIYLSFFASFHGPLANPPLGGTVATSMIIYMRRSAFFDPDIHFGETSSDPGDYPFAGPLLYYYTPLNESESACTTGSNLFYDGGAAATRRAQGQHQVPTSVTDGLFGANCDDATNSPSCPTSIVRNLQQLPWAQRHDCNFEPLGYQFAWTVIGDAPYTFFDPRDNKKPWLTYTWSHADYNLEGPGLHCGEASGLSNIDLDGNNCSAWPLAVPPSSNWADYPWYLAKTDASTSSPPKPLPLFNRFNYNNIRTILNTPPGTSQQQVPNGALKGGARTNPNDANSPCHNCNKNGNGVFVDPTPDWWWENWSAPSGNCTMHYMGIAEGPGAFYYPKAPSGDGRYYVYTSRNTWGGPAYMMVYRVSQKASLAGSAKFTSTTIDQLDYTTNEHVLMASNWVEKFNSGGDFDGNERKSYGDGEIFTAFGKPYVIFHARRALQGENSDCRRIYFKELTLDPDATDGRFLRLYDGGANISKAQDLNWFAKACCPLDFNCDGAIDGIDYDSFMNAFEDANSTCITDPTRFQADFNQDGFVDGIDSDSFLNAWEQGPSYCAGL